MLKIMIGIRLSMQSEMAVESMTASRYAGAPRILSTLARWFGKDPGLEYPVGLEQSNQVLLKPFCPPYYKSMEDAVDAFVQAKFGEDGAYRGGTRQSAWRDSASCGAKKALSSLCSGME